MAAQTTRARDPPTTASAPCATRSTPSAARSAGVATTCLMLLATDGRHLFLGVLFVVSNVCFGASIVLYNAYLNDVASEKLRYGYAVDALCGRVGEKDTAAQVCSDDGVDR